MKRAKWFLVGLLGFCVPVLMAPSGGFPFFPTFGKVTVGNTTRTDTPLIFVAAAATGQPTFELVANGYAAQCMTANNSGGVGSCSMPTGHAGIAQTAQPIDFHATGLQFNEVDFSPTDSGALTFSFQTANAPNCSVNGTDGVIQLHKVGKIVTATVTTTGSCTCATCSNVSTTNTPVAAAFRPVTSSACGTLPVNSGGTSVVGGICVTSAGNFRVQTVTGTGSSIGITSLQSFSYTTD